jgi:hypothetical protein
MSPGQVTADWAVRMKPLAFATDAVWLWRMDRFGRAFDAGSDGEIGTGAEQEACGTKASLGRECMTSLVPQRDSGLDFARRHTYPVRNGHAVRSRWGWSYEVSA